MDRFDDYEREVIAWIAEWGKNSVEKLSSDTKIEGRPLRITGDDIQELLTYLEDRSGVSFSEFDFEKHFGSEDVFGVMALARWWRGLPFEPGTVRLLATYMFERRPSGY